MGALVRTLQPEQGDALLYAASAMFALGTLELSKTPLYQQWAAFALGPYLFAAIGSAAVGWHRTHRSHGVVHAQRHWSHPRVALFLVVLIGATLAPLSCEIAWRSDGSAQAHAQPEVLVIEQAAQRAMRGLPPYHATVSHGRPQSLIKGEPAYESFYPYLPLMTAFGIPSSLHAPVRLTDARVAFSGVTLLVVLIALALLAAPGERKVRALMVLTALPTAALLLATGGDDMPVVAFLLLAMVLAQRRKPGLAGIFLGVASAMKFTAWPLAVLALLCARDRSGRRVPGRMGLGILAVVGPVVTPFLVHNPHVFFVNVILFPLGLSGVPSPAASPLPGHLLVTAVPALHHVLPVLASVLGGGILLRRLVTRPVRTAADATGLCGWVMLVAILVAPATRIGYLVYPINFFVWAFMLRGAEATEPPEMAPVPIDVSELEPAELVLAGGGPRRA
ncbi:MAG: glycosyltransferase 87 family protein [Acidimicrobiales bacterium]